MKFKEVAHLYKGVMMKTAMGDFPLIMYHDSNWFLDTIAYGAQAVEQNIKPYLRPLSSMKPEEGLAVLTYQSNYPVYFIGCDDRFISYRLQYEKRLSKVYHKYFPVLPKRPASILYLLKHDFDIFNLIEAGEAIDATINPPKR